MVKTILSLAAAAVISTLALPGPATAADKRADGLTNATQPTEVSAQRRRRVVRRHYRYPRYRRYAAPRYYGYPRYYGGYYAYAPYPYYYRPYYYGPRFYGPTFSFGFGW